MQQDIELIYAAVRHPQTSGKLERQNRTLKERTASVGRPESWTDWQEWVRYYRWEYNEIRPHEAIAWNRPKEVHLGLADPTIPTFETNEILPTP